MSYKEFRKWCDKRAHDGCWGMLEALTCCGIVGEIGKLPFWKREREWRKVEQWVVSEIVEPINVMIRELLKKEG